MSFLKKNPSPRALPMDFMMQKPSTALANCDTIAVSVANRHRSRVVGVQDFLAGVFLTSFAYPRLRTYWPDFTKFEEYLTRQFGKLGTPEGYTLPVEFKGLTSELLSAHRLAQQLANLHTPSEQGPSTMEPEHVLYAIVNQHEWGVSKELLATGLDLRRLENALKADSAE
jgi:hypothetical protein